METEFKYSVVIPMFNSASTIQRTIDSIINQSRFDLIDEIVVVDDGSKDNSADLVSELEKEIPIIKLIKKSNGGASSARNAGIRSAKNDYIALLDADDEWLPQKMEFQNNILKSRPEVKAIGSNRIGESIKFGNDLGMGLRRISPIQYCVKCWPCTPSLVFDRRVFHGEELYFPEDMTHAEEGLFFLRLAHDCGLYYTEDELVLCGGGKRAFGSSGLSGDIKKMHKGVKQMIKNASKKGYVPKWIVPFLSAYEDIKYIRRIVMTKKYVN